MKAIFAFACFAVEMALAIFLGKWIFGSLNLGVVIWIFMMAASIRLFMVSVPKVTGLLTVDLRTGVLVPYFTGLHFRFPWEQVQEENYINLQLVTTKREETFPSMDGPLMLVKWSCQYRPDPKGLDRYVSVGESTVEEGLPDVVSSILQKIISDKSSEDCKKDQHEIEKAVLKEFNEMVPGPSELYGIELVRFSLADVDYEDKAQKVRVTKMVTDKLREIATEIVKNHPGTSEADALKIAMVINGNLPKSVLEVEGKAGEALAALLVAAGGVKGGSK